MFNCNINVC